MKRIEIDKDGRKEKELTVTQINQLAEDGNMEAKKFVLKKEIILSNTNEQKIQAILRYLE